MASGGATIAMVQRVSKVAMANQMRSRAVSVLLPSCAAKTGQSALMLDVRSVGLVVHKKCSVPKEDLMQFEGLVTEILPDARYRVQLDNGHQLVTYTAGRMKRNRIKTLAGDRVTIEVSPYDLEKGRLIFRHKDERTTSLRRPPQRQQFRRR
jgi:translation initiation factor IF-1